MFAVRINYETENNYTIFEMTSKKIKSIPIRMGHDLLGIIVTNSTSTCDTTIHSTAFEQKMTIFTTRKKTEKT